MTCNFPNIFPGNTYFTQKWDKVVVIDFLFLRGIALIEWRDSLLGVVRIEDMLEGIREGELVEIQSEADGIDETD